MLSGLKLKRICTTRIASTWRHIIFIYKHNYAYITFTYSLWILQKNTRICRISCSSESAEAMDHCAVDALLDIHNYAYSVTSYTSSLLFSRLLHLWQRMVRPSSVYIINRPNGSLAIYVKLRVAQAPGMPGTFPPPPRVSDPDMHHGTCVTHVPWCMLRSLTSGFLWRRWQEKRPRHSRCMRNQQFCVPGKRPMTGRDEPC